MRFLPQPCEVPSAQPCIAGRLLPPVSPVLSRGHPRHIHADAAVLHPEQTAAIPVNRHVPQPAHHTAEHPPGVPFAHEHPLFSPLRVGAEKRQAAAGLIRRALAGEADDAGMVKVVVLLAIGVGAAQAEQLGLLYEGAEKHV